MRVALLASRIGRQLLEFVPALAPYKKIIEDVIKGEPSARVVPFDEVVSQHLNRHSCAHLHATRMTLAPSSPAALDFTRSPTARGFIPGDIFGVYAARPLLPHPALFFPPIAVLFPPPACASLVFMPLAAACTCRTSLTTTSLALSAGEARAPPSHLSSPCVIPTRARSCADLDTTLMCWKDK